MAEIEVNVFDKSEPYKAGFARGFYGIPYICDYGDNSESRIEFSKGYEYGKLKRAEGIRTLQTQAA